MLNRLFPIRSLVMGLIVLSVFTIGSTHVLASNAWFHDGQGDLQAREDWMSQLDDTLRISNLSIPGTHETMARFGGPSYWCQSLRLGQQLRAGIRAVDLRCRHVHDRFAIHHGNKYQAAWFGEPLNIPGHWNAGDESAVKTCIEFLLDNPTETIIMRVKHNQDDDHDPTRAFWQTFQWYLEEDSCVIQDSVYWYKDFFWQDTTWSYQDSLPTLGDIRGKIFVLQEFSSPPDTMFGPEYPSNCDNCFDSTQLISTQDTYKMWWSHKSFNRKWNDIVHFMNQARNGSPDRLYIDYLNGSENVIPKSVANGCVIWFEFCDGMNRRTYYRLKYYFNTDNLGRIGVIMMDYPGTGVIDMIIAQNGLASYYLNDPPVADADGPYEAVEGSEITLDASGSYDPDGDLLQYLWHLWDVSYSADSLVIDTTRIWDAEDWSDTPIAHYTIYDEDTCSAVLEVREVPSDQVVMDAACVTVTNAAPFVSMDSLISPVEGCILPKQELHFYGSFTDPGVFDTHTAQWDFGDGTSLPDTVTEEHEIPDATGTVSHAHVFSEPGTYSVLLTVADDDGGEGEVPLEVWVRTADEAMDFLEEMIQGLPSSCFRGQAAQRKDAFSNKCQAVKHAIIAGGNLEGVINKLMNDIRTKADGSVDGKSRDDWITSEDAQDKLCLIVDELVKYLKSLRGPVSTSAVEQEAPPVRKEGGSGSAKVLRRELIPTEFSLSQCYPNPFNRTTSIAFNLPFSINWSLKIYSMTGQLVKGFEGSSYGTVTVDWDGTDDSGDRVSEGVYFYKLTAGDFTATEKMVLTK